MNHLLINQEIFRIKNENTISLVEQFIQNKIEHYIALFSFQDLLINQDYIVKYTKNIIYNELQEFLIKLIKQNPSYFYLEKDNNVVNIAEQICLKLVPIISYQLDNYINELRQVTLKLAL